MPKRPKTKMRGTQKTAITSYLEPNHSTKSNMDMEQSPIDTLTHAKYFHLIEL